MIPNKHILIVEDSDSSRKALKALVEAAGYRVTCAENGLEALDLLRREERPQVILLDLSMPGMDGWQFRLRQKLHADWSEVPVVVISGEPKVAETAAFMDAADYLRKPVEPAALLEVIRKTA